jgi:RNA polymerase sigma-70 factor (ECF subfamily)
MMHRCEEMSYAQIAQKLSVSESTVEKHMMRILLVAHQVFNSAA